MTDASVADRLNLQFSTNVIEIINADAAGNNKLNTGGILRSQLRTSLAKIVVTADLQLEPAEEVVKLLIGFAKELVSYNEIILSSECYEMAVKRCDNIQPNVNVPDTVPALLRVQCLHGLAMGSASLLLSQQHAHLAPMAVSKKLRCIQQLRQSLTTLVELSPKDQENLSWQVLNCCKLIYELGQPMIWLTAGKYVIESFIFACICMEGVITLCTARHMSFRIKLYATAFYAALSHGGGSVDEAQRIVDMVSRQVADFREREELDPPMPIKSEGPLICAECDVAVMRNVLEFWRNPDSFDLSDSALMKFKFPTFELIEKCEKYVNRKRSGSKRYIKSLQDRCLNECIRVQQLTSGNTNEVWKKRSSALLKGFWKSFESRNDIYFPLSDESEPSNLVSPIFSLGSLLEIVTVAMFDATEDTPIIEILQKVWAIVLSAPPSLNKYHPFSVSPVALNTSLPPDYDDDGLEELAILQKLAALTLMAYEENEESPSKLEIAAELMTMLHVLISSPRGISRKTFIRRVSMGVWVKYIYPTLQTILSSDNANESVWAGLSVCLEGCVRGLEMVNEEDPLLYGGLVIIAAKALWCAGEFRDAISLLRKGIDATEENRASLVDVQLHMPEDAKDISALQRQSFSTRLDSQDWFHSLKRLGAHAFAGFGIFGNGSSTDRTNQALAEIHADMLAIYFRCELEYSIHQKKSKQSQIRPTSKKENENTQNVTTTANKTAATTGMTSWAAFPGTLSINQTVSAESLSIVTALKSYCCKNMYAKCILLLEMVRIEKDEDTRKQYLKDAFALIEEAEASESTLVQAFQDLSVMTEPPQRTPIVLARSHKFIYIVPVDCKPSNNLNHGRTQTNSFSQTQTHSSKNIPAYYKVYAKEQGSGTDVSLVNNDMSGCEKIISPSILFSPSLSAVKVESLRAGERYVFACAAMNSKDSPTHPISPTTICVEALNPLPTIFLWSFLAHTASSYGARGIAKEASRRVCERYFTSVPTQEVMTFGKGIPVFLGGCGGITGGKEDTTEPYLCMLAVQQATTLALSLFVKAYLLLEGDDSNLKETNRNGTEGPIIHWDLRVNRQLERISVLRRTSSVTLVAAFICSQELICECVSVGYRIASELMEFDRLHLASSLIHPILILTHALQTIPKRNWKELEHGLYVRLVHSLVQICILNRNTAPVVALLGDLMPEFSDATESLALTKSLTTIINSKLEMQYSALSESFGLANGVCSSSLAMTQLQSILSLPSSTATSDTPSFWTMTEAKRKGGIKGKALSLAIAEEVAPDLLALDTAIKSAFVFAEDPSISPPPFSFSLSLLAQLIRECIRMHTPTHSISLTQAITNLLTRYPVTEKGMSANSWAECISWGLLFVKPSPSPVTAAAAALEGEGEGDVIVPSVSFAKGADDSAQLAALAHINLLVTTHIQISKRNHFPSSIAGPLLPIDPFDWIPTVIQEENDIVVEGEISTQSTPGTPGLDLIYSREQWLRALLASITLFAKSSYVNACVSVIADLWRWIIDEWMDPQEFVREFKSLCSGGGTKGFCECLTIVLNLLENIGGGLSGVLAGVVEQSSGGTISYDDMISGQSESMSGGGGGTSIAKIPSKRTFKEHLLLIREYSVFVIKLLWLNEEYEQVVVQGSRLCALYIEEAPSMCRPVCDACLPLMVHSQQCLNDRAQEQLNARHSEMDKFVADFEEYLKKKRRKKLRVKRLEKDEDEIRFDAEKAVYQEKIDAATLILTDGKARANSLKGQQKRFDTLFSSGKQLLEKVRKSSRRFLKRCISEGSRGSSAFVRDESKNFDYRLCLTSKVLSEELEDVLDQFTQVGHFLREKKDTIALIECLKEQGDLFLLFGRQSESRQVWHDAIDGLFNTMDTYANWEPIAAAVTKKMSFELANAIIPISIVLGKLSKFCGGGDWDTKSGYCRFAAELIRALFVWESVGHPQNASGFAAYVCLELGGRGVFSVDPDAISAASLTVALTEIITVLTAESHTVNRLAAFPVVVLLEHYHSIYTRHPSDWLQARLNRIRLLVASKLYAEAASMISSIRPSILAITSHKFSDPISHTSEMKTSSEFDTRANGLDFYNKAPYFNHLPPHDPLNLKAIEWISQFPKEFEEFSSTFTVEIPLTPEQRIAAAEAAAAAIAAAAAAAEEAAKGKKGKAKAPEEVTPPPSTTPTVPLFPPIHSANMALECANLLISLSNSDRRTTLPHSPTLAMLGSQGDDLLSSSLVILASLLSDRSDAEVIKKGGLGDVGWIECYGRCILLRAGVRMRTRKIKDARGFLLSFAQLLQSPKLADDVSPSSRTIITHLWLCVKECMSECAERQGRFTDAIKICTQAAQEASLCMSGYWLRIFLFRRAQTHFKVGNFEASLTDCNVCLQQYKDKNITDLCCVKVWLLKAAVIRTTNLASSRQESAVALLECLRCVRKAQELSFSLAKSIGFIGADANATYEASKTLIMNHDALPPHTFSLTSSHSNIPPLSLPPRLNSKLLNSRISISSATTTTTDRPSNVSAQPNPLVGLRLGPVDPPTASAPHTYSPSPFANIYWEEIRTCVSVSASLCMLLDECGSGGVHVAEESGDDGNEGTPMTLLQEHILCGETCLKLLRHCVYPSASASLWVLLSVGRTRMATALEGGGGAMNGKLYLSPLLAALELGVAESVCASEMLKRVCVCICECYGDPSLSTESLSMCEGVSGCAGECLTHAAVYAKAAMRCAYNTYSINHSLNIAGDKSFSDPPSEELLAILESMTSSSATRPKVLDQGPAVVASNDKKAAAAPAGKGKAPAGGANAATAVPELTGPNGRDAMSLLCTLTRECDPLLLDSYERDVCDDLHSLLRKAHPLYSASCSLPHAPDVHALLNVALGSVSSLWVPTSGDGGTVSKNKDAASVGLFTHACVYFLLGAKIQSPPPTSPEDPILAKCVCERADCIVVKNSFSDLKDKLVDAQTKGLCDQTFLVGVCSDMCECVRRLVVLLSSGSEKSLTHSFSLTKAPPPTITSSSSSSSSSSSINAEEKVKIEFECANDGSNIRVTIKHAHTDALMSCSLPVSPSILASLASIVNTDYSISESTEGNGSVCTLIRASLGYTE